MKRKLITLATLALALSPSLAFAHPVLSGSAHQQTSTHDRSPRIHEHSTVAHH